MLNILLSEQLLESLYHYFGTTKNTRKRRANIAASDLYYELINLANSSEETQAIADEMFKKHGGSIYETLTKFILSKKEFETKNFDLAKKSILKKLLS